MIFLRIFISAERKRRKKKNSFFVCLFTIVFFLLEKEGSFSSLNYYLNSAARVETTCSFFCLHLPLLSFSFPSLVQSGSGLQPLSLSAKLKKTTPSFTTNLFIVFFFLRFFVSWLLKKCTIISLRLVMLLFFLQVQLCKTV